ncbi:hypothetical protein CCACVL1_16119 [Corchorus capsularis]|uniref:Uncharacterized protein n=1 Tax=Corchorus capsularis TaxID=210143 RepID=A0A1R3HZ64_COCAP|nr:hypothetical protein CCACVL1_16119 [Corchorus capsularis]
MLNVQVKLIHHFIGNSLWYKQGSLGYINHKDIWLLYCIWKEIKVNLAQIIINEIKKTASKDNNMLYGFGPIVTALGQIVGTKMNEHKDITNTNKVLNLMADKILGRTFEDEYLDEPDVPDIQQQKEPEATLVEKRKQQRNSDEEEIEEEETSRQEDNDENEEAEEEENEKENSKEENNETDDDEAGAEEEYNKSDDDEDEVSAPEDSNKANEELTSSAAVGETNAPEVPSGTDTEIANMTLATTAEVLTGLKPLATALASLKGKDKAKVSSSSASSPTKKAFTVSKPKKMVTKKARTAIVEKSAHVTESDVVSEHTEPTPPVPKKRLRTKHPNIEDAPETILAKASKPAKNAGVRQSKRIKKA